MVQTFFYIVDGDVLASSTVIQSPSLARMARVAALLIMDYVCVCVCVGGGGGVCFFIGLCWGGGGCTQ